MKRLKISFKLVLALSISFFSIQAMAAGPGQGSLTRNNIRVGNCNVDAITVKWNLGSLMGEPTVSGTYEWSGANNCELPSSTTIWLRVVYGTMRGYVGLSPVAPKSNGGFGYNTTGSPNWAKTLCSFSGKNATSCLDESSAKELWKNGNVDGFSVAW